MQGYLKSRDYQLSNQFTITGVNVHIISTVANLAELYGYVISDSKINFNDTIFNIVANEINCTITITKYNDNNYSFEYSTNVSLGEKLQNIEYKHIEHSIDRLFSKLQEHISYSKIKFNFKEQLGPVYVNKIINDTFDTISLSIDDIIVICKTKLNLEMVQHKDAKIEFDVNIKLGNNILAVTTLLQNDVIKLIKYYESCDGLKFLMNFMKILTRFNPKILSINFNEKPNAIFEMEINDLGEAKNTMKINLQSIVTSQSNPLDYIYCIQYAESCNFIVGTNLVKLLYLISGGNMEEYESICNIKHKKNTTEKLPKGDKQTRLLMKTAKKAKAKKAKAKKAKAPKVKAPKVLRVKATRVPAFIQAAANYVPSRNQPYPLSFTTLERTIKTFGENHKAVLKRFTNSMTHAEFVEFKNAFNNQVGFTPEQTQLIQMLPDDKDYVIAFFKVYDLI